MSFRFRALLQKLLAAEPAPVQQGLDTASVARERLASVLAQQRGDGMRGVNLLEMQKDIISVVGKYMKVDFNDVTVGGMFILKLCLFYLTFFFQRLLQSEGWRTEQKLWKFKSRSDNSKAEWTNYIVL